eukprot:TRINITY_DN11753_c0_g1_i2.p1 TRINITY_DN11753_c0_g1~~TRINITY_DN11753_c0_g1_i2.p1  ORF type:complete len:432 (-),score=85.69 TRINITY_DN11753_c0_g1_i2:211-1506(-)
MCIRDRSGAKARMLLSLMTPSCPHSIHLAIGVFDPVSTQPYTHIGVDAIGTAAHRQLAYQIAAQGLVLLQNPSSVLPFSTSLTTAVIGPHANSNRSLLGSYFDQACPGVNNWDCIQTPLQAISNLTRVCYSQGCEDIACKSNAYIKDAVAAARKATQVVLLVGIDEHQEGEGNDRTTTRLPGAQEELVAAVVALGKPTVLVMLNGGIVSVDLLRNQTLNQNLAAVEAWYPGVSGAAALADTLFGLQTSWGKLPVSVYASSFSSQVHMTDMAFTTGLGRTYKYWAGDAPLFEFGTGLSYTTFSMSWAQPLSPVTFKSVSDTTVLRLKLTNTGGMTGDEVLLLFHSPTALQSAPVPLPVKQLVDFSRATLESAQVTEVKFTVTASMLGLVDGLGNKMLYAGWHKVSVSRGHGEVLSCAVRVDVPAPVVIETLF